MTLILIFDFFKFIIFTEIYSHIFKRNFKLYTFDRFD